MNEDPSLQNHRAQADEGRFIGKKPLYIYLCLFIYIYIYNTRGEIFFICLHFPACFGFRAFGPVHLQEKISLEALVFFLGGL